ncbi:MAG: DUF6115 domain-containing protein [Clostridiales bacterium]|nr:DUF6115 domain-containing protein [Clostridiales bacterium]
MSTLEIVMMILGIGFIIVSYCLSSREGKNAKDGGKTVKEVQISVNQFFEDNKEVLNRHLEQLLDDTYEDWKEDSKEELGKITNEKIMAFQEFSDQILEKIDSNHKEVVFLYDMLTKKEDEMKKLVQVLDRVRAKAELELEEKPGESTAKAESGIVQAQQRTKKKTESLKAANQTDHKKTGKDLQSEKLEKKVQAKQGKKPVGTIGENNNDRILSLYQEGKSIVEISRILGKGQGEVKLVIDLFMGSQNS